MRKAILSVFVVLAVIARFSVAMGAVADSFQYPISPVGSAFLSFSDKQAFLQFNPDLKIPKYHLGEDWNINSGGSEDLGKPVYATANGIVSWADDLLGSWGKVIIIKHELPSGSIITSLYGHLNKILVSRNQVVTKGQQIGEIGDANGVYANAAHLHFEIRPDASMLTNTGFGYVPTLTTADKATISHYTDPTMFIERGLFSKVFPLVPGWNYITNSFDTAIDLNIATVLSKWPRASPAQAASTGVLYSLVYEWVNGGWKTFDLRVGSYPLLPGHSYWIYSFQPDIALMAFGKNYITRDTVAKNDMVKRVAPDPRFTSAIPSSFGQTDSSDPAWDLRWMSFNLSRGGINTVYHTWYKYDNISRYTGLFDPDTGAWTGWIFAP